MSRGFSAREDNLLHHQVLSSRLPLLVDSVRMTRFRPCIDLHAGAVKQIVGGTLDYNSASSLKTNYTSTLPASHFATLYREHDLIGGHLIMLGPGNEEAAQEATALWPKFLQVGGGITPKNAALWMDRGAEKVGFDIGSTGLH